MDPSIVSIIFTKAFTLFLMLDPLGNIGLIAALLRHYEPNKQSRILRREVSIALVVMLAFYFGGSLLLGVLNISHAAVEITGSIVLFLFALNLLFPNDSPVQVVTSNSEPFIVPIAVPLIAGPSVLATIMLLSQESSGTGIALSAIFFAWLSASAILLASPLIIRLLGRVGIGLTEQLMGLLCALIAVKNFFNGLTYFINS